jgi:hypothetical protein
MALIDDFKTRFPAFDTAVVDQYLPILVPVWPCYYGGTYDDTCEQEIILNLIAHLLVTETIAGNGNVKSTSSQSVGNVSVSYSEGYASNSERSAWFKTTKYGSRYLMLTRKRQGGVFV